MKKILSIFLSSIISIFYLNSCKIQNNNLEKNNEFIEEANQDIETFYKILTLIKKKIKRWWDNKSIININDFYSDKNQINDFFAFLKTYDKKNIVKTEINKWTFLNNLIIDFKKEIDNINKEIINNYSNFYYSQEKELPIVLSNDDIKLIVNKIDFNNISSKLFMIDDNQKKIDAFTINFYTTYSFKYKEFEQIYENSTLITVTNNIEILNNIQTNIESWFVDFIYKIFNQQDRKIINSSSNINFNEINSNKIWQIVKQELNKKNIITNNKPHFSDFFNTFNLWSAFFEYNSIMALTGEGYQQNKLTAENFLDFYKKINKNITYENDYYIKANIKYFISNDFTIENLPFKQKENKWIILKNPIAILISKDEFDKQLLNFSKKIINFWHYYKLETYKNKLVFNMDKSNFDILQKKINLFKPDNSINVKISTIFKTIFEIFNKKFNETENFKLKIFESNKFDYLKNKENASKFKMKIINNDKEIIIKLSRERLSNGNYPFYYINFSYNDFGYSFFLNPKNNEKNNTNNNEYLQTIEFKII